MKGRTEKRRPRAGHRAGYGVALSAGAAEPSKFNALQRKPSRSTRPSGAAVTRALSASLVKETSLEGRHLCSNSNIRIPSGEALLRMLESKDH